MSLLPSRGSPVPWSVPIDERKIMYQTECGTRCQRQWNKLPTDAPPPY